MKTITTCQLKGQGALDRERILPYVRRNDVFVLDKKNPILRLEIFLPES